MNLVFNMLLGVGAAGVAVLFLVFVSTSVLGASLVFIIGLLAVNFGIYKLLENRFPKMLERIE